MKTCPQCQSPFEFAKEDLLVHDKMKVPAPTHCFDCRNQRRLAFRNDQNYYKNTCHLCQKSLVSIYSPDKPIKVLCSECFWSDKFDPLAYGVDFDFTKPFFSQYEAMRAQVPRLAIFNSQSDNAEFTVHSSRNRNCYMASSLMDSEDVHYSAITFNSRDCMDMFACHRMEMCYECVQSQDCAHSNYLDTCSNVSQSFFCYDCRGSQMLVGCVSMRNRKNHILNVPSSEAEVKETIHKLKTDAVFFEEFRAKYENLKAIFPKRDTRMLNTENCSGDYLTNSKNSHYAFNMENTEDCRYIHTGHSLKDCYDVTHMATGEFLYECKAGIDLKFSKFCNLTYHSDNMAYCDNCQNASYCFGSMSLKGNQYVFLNKQYTKDEYHALIPKVIEHMRATGEYGEFFPVELSPFGYNEVKAQEFYPLTREEALKKGWNWSDYEAPAPKVDKVIPASQLPYDIKEIPDDILNWAIDPETGARPFRLISAELAFYRKKGLPVPHLSPKERHQKRMKTQIYCKLFDRECGKCGIAIRTTYRPDRPEKIYCEACYLKEVY